MIIIIFNYKKLLPLTPLEVKPLMQVWLISTLMLVKNQIHVVAQQRDQLLLFLKQVLYVYYSYFNFGKAYNKNRRVFIDSPVI